MAISSTATTDNVEAPFDSNDVLRIAADRQARINTPDVIAAAHGPGCTEVAHLHATKGPCVYLRTMANGKQVLEHAAIGERVLLDPATTWHLEFGPGNKRMAYIWAQDVAPVWANDKFTMSLWHTPGGIFFIKKKIRDAATREVIDVKILLLAELAKTQHEYSLHWEGDEDHLGMPKSARIIRLDVPRSGSRYWFRAIDFQDAVNFMTPTNAGSQWLKHNMPKWVEKLRAYGVPSDHFNRPFGRSNMGTIGDVALTTQTWTMSFHATLGLLCIWATTVREAQDATNCKRALQALLRFGFGDSTVSFNVDRERTANPVEPLATGTELMFRDGKLVHVSNDPTGAFWRRVLLHENQPAKLLLRTVVMKRPEVFSGLLMGFSRASDERLDGHRFEEFAAKDLVHQQPRRGRMADRLVRSIQHKMVQAGARSCRQAAATGRSHGLHVPTYESWVAHSRMRQLFWATRRSFSCGISFGMAPDKSRMSGKNWLKNSLFCHDVNRITWAAPQVGSVGKQNVYWLCCGELTPPSVSIRTPPPRPAFERPHWNL